jgi:hypothetical protein
MTEGRATAIVDALKAQPLTLALIVLSFVFMYFIYSGVATNRKEIHEVLKTTIEKCVVK